MTDSGSSVLRRVSVPFVPLCIERSILTGGLVRQSDSHPRDAGLLAIYSSCRVPKKPDTSPPKSFESALAELETILADIEGGQVGLEESLVKYERGNFLIQHCRAILSGAEKKIELLSRAENGELSSRPLDETGESEADARDNDNEGDADIDDDADESDE